MVGQQELAANTRARAQTLRSALEVHEQRLVQIAAAAGVTAVPGGAGTSPVPGEGTLTSYFHQIHRDWGWDTQGEYDEVGDAVASVLSVLEGGDGLGDMLVLGAGACRLPWEIHVRACASSTLALDVNPLPFWVARRLLRGETLDLLEFPIRPRSTGMVAVDRALSAKRADAGPFAFAFADGLDPPVRPHAFDTVFTPWFIDQIPKDLADIFEIVHGVLKPGGTWINHGPLIYHPTHTALMHRYCADEVLAMAAAAGFRIERESFVRLPYMVSPAGSQGRTEMVLSFRATNVRSGEDAVGPAAPEPEVWLTDPNIPIPRLDGLSSYTPPHPMFAAIVAAIDGRRSAADIGRLLALQHNVPAASATDGVRAALAEIYRALCAQHP